MSPELNKDRKYGYEVIFTLIVGRSKYNGYNDFLIGKFHCKKKK